MFTVVPLVAVYSVELSNTIKQMLLSIMSAGWIVSTIVVQNGLAM